MTAMDLQKNSASAYLQMLPFWNKKLKSCYIPHLNKAYPTHLLIYRVLLLIYNRILKPNSYTMQLKCHFQRHFVTRQNATFSKNISLVKLYPTLVCTFFFLEGIEFIKSFLSCGLSDRIFFGDSHATKLSIRLFLFSKYS